jgi:energy-coupling factor transporter ATP-binding protein EcfA2
MNPIIDIKEVTFTYLGEEEPALSNVSLSIMPGDYVLILGPSGSGKSTLLNLMNSSIPNIFEGTLEGTVVVDGLDTSEHSLANIASVVGMVFQDPDSQLVNVFVEDEVYFGPENLCMEREQIIQNANDAIDLTDMHDFLHQEVFYLSGGQKQKLALASVLAMQPKVILLDQPTANLDPRTRIDVFNILAKLNKQLGLTVVVIEHEVDDIADAINKVVVMDEGKIVHLGDPRTIFARSGESSSKSLGLWVPQMSELAIAMKNKFDIEFDLFPITVEEALPKIEQLLKGQDDQLIDNLPYIPVSERYSENEVPFVEVRHLNFSYGVTDQQALTDISFKMHKGEFLAIMGKNGSGKSTLAKAIMKINKVPEGSIFIEGKDINKISVYELTEKIGYVFQSPDHQFVTDTVFDEVAYSLRVRGIDEEIVHEKVMEVLELFNLDRYTALSPFALSMGQRRLLSVATMLVLEQELLILDEPTISQDQVSANLVMEYLEKLNKKGISIVIISHDMRLISKWVDRVYVMTRSRMLFDGDTREAFNSPDLMEREALVPPPLSELMWNLRERGLHAPSTVFTVDKFVEIYEKEIFVS